MEREEIRRNCAERYLIHSDLDGSFVRRIWNFGSASPILPLPRNSYFSIWITNMSSDHLFKFMLKGSRNFVPHSVDFISSNGRILHWEDALYIKVCDSNF
uniref:Uncharacterized protein n=1 Tax=Lepeophtheirus salmonis TaxID=72036 RepID=A0A0K2TM06_LEPSM